MAFFDVASSLYVLALFLLCVYERWGTACGGTGSYVQTLRRRTDFKSSLSETNLYKWKKREGGLT